MLQFMTPDIENLVYLTDSLGRVRKEPIFYGVEPTFFNSTVTDHLLINEVAERYKDSEDILQDMSKYHDDLDIEFDPASIYRDNFPEIGRIESMETI